MTRINTNGAFLGVRGLYRDYRLYVFMAESYVFARSRNAVIAVFGVYAAAVVVMLLLLAPIRSASAGRRYTSGSWRPRCSGRPRRIRLRRTSCAA